MIPPFGSQSLVLRADCFDMHFAAVGGWLEGNYLSVYEIYNTGEF